MMLKARSQVSRSTRADLLFKTTGERALGPEDDWCYRRQIFAPGLAHDAFTLEPPDIYETG
jgi:hypothetical protein